MSEPRIFSNTETSGKPSQKAVVVKVIRGNSEGALPSKPATREERQETQTARRSHDELATIRKVVNQAGQRTKFRDFSERLSQPETNTDSPKKLRLSRGPHFPMATSLRFAAVFYILGRLSIIATVVCLGWFAFTRQGDYLIIAPIVASAILFTFIAWGMSNGLCCRVCTMPFLAKRKCKMSQKAPKLPFVSHHFTVALHILAHNYPRCPYCGTTNRLKK